MVDKKIIDAQLKLKAKEKLAKILRNKEMADQQLRVSDPVEVCNKMNKNIRGNKRIQRIVLQIDCQ